MLRAASEPAVIFVIIAISFFLVQLTYAGIGGAFQVVPSGSAATPSANSLSLSGGNAAASVAFALSSASGGNVKCSNYCNTGGPYGGSACASTAYTTTPTTCYVSETFNTVYQQASNPLFGTPQYTSPYYQSPADRVSSYNVYNAPWFLTCPLNPNNAPNPLDSRLFYTSPYNNNQYPFVAGDVCLANTQTLTTQMTLPVSITWDTSTPASASVGTLSTQNGARLQISLLAYSPEFQSGLQNIISSTYYNSSYIFQNPPAVAQNSIWTWSAVFANFGGSAPDTQTVSATPIIDKSWQIPQSSDDDSGGALSGASNSSRGAGTANQSLLAGSGGSGSAQSKPSVSLSGGSATSRQADFATASCPPGSVCAPLGVCAGEGGICVAQGSCSASYCCCSVNGGTSTVPTSTTSTTSISTTSTIASTTTSISTTTTIETYPCQYSYTYSETTSLQSVSNVQIPFNEVVTQNIGGTPQVSYNKFDTPILPYFTYSFSVPSQDSQLMSLSYDIFGPWNYYTPANSIDLFPIDTPARFYVSYNGVLVSGPADSLGSLTSLQGLFSSIGNMLNNMLNLANLGNMLHLNSGNKLGNPLVSDPISVAANPNDYIYVLNQSSSNGDYYISVLRLIPHGYYNSSSYPPSSVPSVSVDSSQQAQGLQQYTNNWKSYWGNVIDMQNQTTYVIRSIDLGTSQLTDPNTFIGHYLTAALINMKCDIKNPAQCRFILQFTPTNISVDDYGDVFITGDSEVAGFCSNLFTQIAGWIAGSTPIIQLLQQEFGISVPVGYYPCIYQGENIIKIPDANGPAVPTPNQMENITGTWTAWSGVPTLTEIAASPTGGLVFVGGPNSGYLEEFNGQSLSNVGSVSLSFNVTTSTSVGQNIVLNIPYYLQNGGLYNLSIPGLYSSGANFNPATDFDKASYHHVLGLQDVNGYLYVLDDWSAGLNSQSCYTFYSCPNANMNMLMVRVLNSTGFSVPLSPTLFNDLYQQQQCYATGQVSLLGQCTSTPPGSQVQCNPSNYCSLYSTICSGGGSNGNSPPKYKYECAASGTQTSTYYETATGIYGNTTTYPPYGWVLSANITVNGQAPINFCSSAYNAGTNNPACGWNPENLPPNYKGNFKPIGPALANAYVAPQDVGFTVNYNDTINLIIKPGSTGSWHLCTAFGVLPYPCYTTITSPHYDELIVGTTLNVENYTKLFDGESLQPVYCLTDSQADSSPSMCQYLNSVSYMKAPVYTVTNPFRYLESLGTAQQLTFAGEIYSNLPPGAASQSCASILTNGQFCSGTGYSSQGPPKLSIQQSPVNWGIGDQITVQSATATNTVEILIDGQVVASTQGQVTYTICSTIQTCLSAGTHQIEGEDVTSGQSTSTTLTVNPTPLLTLSPPVQVEGNPEYITANSFNGADSVELLINGQIVAGPSPGSVSYTESNLAPSAYTVEALDTSNNQQSTATLYVVSSSVGSASSSQQTALTESLASQIAGNVIVPYEYTYQLTQTWGNPSPTANGPYHNGVIAVTDSDDYQYANNNGCPTTGVFAQQGTTSSSTTSVFSYALTQGSSNQLAALIEGGPTYLHDIFNNDYFVPNLTDNNLILPPQIRYVINNDKLWATIYVNSTLCPSTGSSLDCSRNSQLVLNATNNTIYQVMYYMQTSPNNAGQALGGYKVFGSSLLSQPSYSASLVHGTPAVFASNAAVFNSISLFEPTSVPLFSYYKQVVYDSPLDLYLNGTTYANSGYSGLSLLGYQRLTYVFVDRFGNRVYAPIDADIAYPVTVTLNVQSTPSLSNPNSTTVDITGQAGIFSNLGSVFTPLGPNNSIYLYYDKDLNFVHYNPITDPTNAIYCAYSANAPWALNCTPSNPILAGHTANSNQITYAPTYNALGVCGPPPAGLLEKSVRACNIYGLQNLPTTCPATGMGSEEFCAPVYANGTGFCTSQLGLIGIAKTGVDGTFNAIITACGSRIDQILAKFYGYPGPEPVQVSQPPLYLAENSVGSYSGVIDTTNNINYQYAPSKQAVAVFQIGEFLLSYNDIGALAIIASILTALALLYLKRR